MSLNISGFGTSVQVVGSATFPNGFTVTQFADDADAVDMPDVSVGDTAMGLNGDLVVWSHPNALDVSLSVIPRSPDDVNLMVLLDANRVAKGKRSARDAVTLAIAYPDGSSSNFVGGNIISGPPASPVASSGRLKTHTYRFRFENVTKANM